MKKFDTVIIGGGIGGLMAAYRLQQKCPAFAGLCHEFRGTSA